MKITFRCPGCNKLLKARPDSVGRTRKCPVCATRVTCREPVLEAQFLDAGPVDAEIVEAEVVAAAPKAAPATRRGAGAAEPAPDRAFNPFADVDDDPYQLAEPDPVTASAPEPQKPCPMCGEMILASAVKCRYCGEVFDPKLKKGKSKKRRKASSGGRSSSTGVRDMGIGIACAAAGVGLTVFSYAYAASNSSGGGRYLIFHGLVIGGIIQFFRGVRGVVSSD